MKKIGKILGAILAFAVFTFLVAMWGYTDYADNWKPSTEVPSFEQYYFVYALTMASVLFVLDFIRWAIKVIRGK